MDRLADLIRDLSRLQDLNTFLANVIQVIVDLVPCEQTLVLMFEPETETLKIVACEAELKNALKAIRLPLERSLAGQVYHSGRSFLLQNAQGDPRLYLELEQVFDKPTRNLAIVPMIFRGETVGVLEARNKRGEQSLNAEDLELLEALAALIAVTVMGNILFDEIQQAYEQVKTLERMKANFIAIASHELRTPIGLILGHASFVQELIEDPEVKPQMDVILRNASKLKEIVEDLTRVNEYDQGTSRIKRKTVSIRLVVQNVVAVCMPRARQKNTHLYYKLPETDLLVEADEEKIHVVLANLVNNGIAFTDPGGQVAVIGERLPGYIQVSVIDNGIGIPTEDLPHVFDRFFQVQSHLTRHHGGLGLGLSVAKAMIEIHKGQIWAESKEGQGSKFTFILPTQASTLERLQGFLKQTDTLPKQRG